MELMSWMMECSAPGSTPGYTKDLSFSPGYPNLATDHSTITSTKTPILGSLMMHVAWLSCGVHLHSLSAFPIEEPRLDPAWRGESASASQGEEISYRLERKAGGDRHSINVGTWDKIRRC